ncbi:MAG TPA: VOC family protein [Polyangiaceae bacterium]|nr:VOC family protein [Polyangiaceae bacterium]
MSWQIDHVFFATADADAAEREITQFGVTFTRRVAHHGQGTANACAMFENAFFEILRPVEYQELRCANVRPLGLEERIHWRETGACPFGVCFRPSDADGALASWPFETWRYEAAYLPTGACIPIVTPVGCLAEPLVFLATKPRSVNHEMPLHRGAVRRLTGVKVVRVGSASVVSQGVRWFSENGYFSLADGAAHRLELEWNHGAEGNMHAFADGLPIVLRW